MLISLPSLTLSSKSDNRCFILSPAKPPSTITWLMWIEFSAYSFANAWAKFLRAPLAELKAPKLDLPLKDALAPVKIRVPAVLSIKNFLITS